MEMQFEAAKGTLEQVLATRSPVVMRVLLPGALASILLYPSIPWVLNQLQLGPDNSWQRLMVIAGVVVALGEVISLFTDEIYKIYEGRILWPRWLLKWGLERQRVRLKRIQKRSESALDQQSCDEAWHELRLYPLNDKSEPEVQRPTLLGNVLAGYEQYPDNRYGMDSVFYWPRIWLQIDKDKKEEIDNLWCVADGLLILSAVSSIGGAPWIMDAVAYRVSALSLPLEAPLPAALAGIGWFIAGYGLYRLSIPHHRTNGELFKSTFDLYRAKVWDLTSLRPAERQAWDAAWSYLQYFRLVCPGCGRMNAASTKTCECGYDLEPVIRNVRYFGRLSRGPD